MALQHLRSSTANKRPLPAGMSDGQLAINTNNTSPGLFFKNSAGALVKVGPVHVGTTAPNASPAGGGETGNSVGEQWLDTTGGTYVFKVWDGSAWRSESGTFVDVNGDTMTGALGIIAGTAGAPGLFFSGDTNTGIYSPGADQVAISTGGSGRLFINSSGQVGIGGIPSYTLDVSGIIRSNEGTQQGRLIVGSDGNGVFYRDANSLRVWTRDTFPITFWVNDSEKARIDSSGRLGVGTSSPNALLHLSSATGSATPTPTELRIATTTNASNWSTTDPWGRFSFYSDDSSNAGPKIHAVIDALATSTAGGTSSLRFAVSDITGALIDGLRITPTGSTGLTETTLYTSGSERARIDSSGRLLVGTSSDTSGGNGNALLQVVPSGPGRILPGRSDGNTAADLTIGAVDFRSFAGSVWESVATITALSDGVSGSGDKPGRLVFSTTADGASSPTEAMRIRNNGQVLIGATADAKSGKLEVTGRLAVLNGRETIQTGSATYTASTTATEIIQFDSGAGGFFGAELFVTLCDTASPAGTIVQKVYVAARGSGTNVTAASISQTDILRQTSDGGTFTGYLTWTAAVVSNRARLSVTATQASGDATLTVHCNGAPFSFLI